MLSHIDKLFPEIIFTCKHITPTPLDFMSTVAKKIIFLSASFRILQ